MRVSLRWLNELVPVTVEVGELTERLDLSGTKVEEVHRPDSDVEGIVVAEVLAIEPHPRADALTLVTVGAGDGTSQRVVCGARNFALGDRVPFAPVGARLPEITIGERTIRGEPSRGMLCSAAELGISNDHSGIFVLPAQAPVGDEVVPLLGLDDTIIELEITTNRPDCMGMIGVAREVAALLDEDLRPPRVDLQPSGGVSHDVTVSLEDPKGCPRYVARVVDDVSIDRSPLWLSARLLAAGVRPISNVVDVTNYVMLETGQPLHAFDEARIGGGRIVVRRARSGEDLTTLDGVTRSLHTDDLIIADASKPMAIAGVMGGEESEVSATTTTVVLESAYFEPASVAWTSRRHLLRTEASARFERGTDPNGPLYAADRAATLLSEVVGGKVAAEAIDAYPAPIAPLRLTLRPRRTDALLGAPVDPERQASLLRSVEIRTEPRDGLLEVEVPTFRPDLTREIDLIEEVARLEGYGTLPSTVPSGPIGGLDDKQQAGRRLRRALAGSGVREAWTNSFGSPRQLDLLGLPDDDPRRNTVKVMNPTTEDEPALRTTLLPNLLGSAAHNLARRAPGVALFEIASVYEPSGETLPNEPVHLAAVFTRVRRPAGWGADAKEWDFFGAKGVLESVASALRLGTFSFTPVDAPPWHPTRAAAVALDGMRVGELGDLHPDVCARFDVPDGTVAFEVLLDPLLECLPGRPRVGELTRFPSAFIDLAVVVTDGVPAADVEATIRRAGEPELVAVSLFDLYRGDQVPEGRKSLAYALELRSAERTLTDDDARAVRERIVGALQRELQAELRR